MKILNKLFQFIFGPEEEEIKPSKSLATFLKSEDLDDLLTARQNLESLNESDNQLIRNILSRWKDKQGISNLLIYPELISKEKRFDSIVKGLNEQHVLYYNLAAIVGIQSPKKLDFTDEEKSHLKRHLFMFLNHTDDIRAMRATSSIQHYIETEDINKVINSSKNKNESVRINLFRILVGLHGEENLKEMLQSKMESFKEEVNIFLGLLDDHYQKIEDAPEDKKGFFKLTISMPLLGYIPNLKDFG